MDVASYTQARYGRLLEHAVELGAPDGQAAAYVDQVLLDQRRRIKRAHDPDPMVRDALAKAIRGERGRGRELFAVWLVLAFVLVSVGLAAVLYAPPPRPLPSLFGYSGAQARALLERDGFAVELRPARACEPQGLVLATSPRVGEVLPRGSAVIVRTAVPSDESCGAPTPDRADAWAFVAWAEGVGPTPALAGRVTVVVDARPGSLEAVRRVVADAASRPAPTRTGMPGLTVSSAAAPTADCGVAQPVGTTGREPLRLGIDPARDTGSDDEPSDCPLTVDLYRTDGAIDTVVVTTPVGSAP